MLPGVTHCRGVGCQSATETSLAVDGAAVRARRVTGEWAADAHCCVTPRHLPAVLCTLSLTSPLLSSSPSATSCSPWTSWACTWTSTSAAPSSCSCSWPSSTSTTTRSFIGETCRHAVRRRDVTCTWPGHHCPPLLRRHARMHLLCRPLAGTSRRRTSCWPATPRPAPSSTCCWRTSACPRPWTPGR